LSSVATVVFSEKVTEASAETAANYQLLGTNGALLTNIASITMTDADAAGAGTTVQMTFTTPADMVTGVTIQVIPGLIATPDGRKVAAASTVITDDATAPSATLTALIGTNGGTKNVFKVSFSEPVKGTLTAASFILGAAAQLNISGVEYTLGGAAANPPKAAGLARLPIQPMYDAATITLVDDLGQAQTLAIKAAVVTDPAGNANTAASTVVAADGSKPTLTSATLAVTATATAQVVDGNANMVFEAKIAGVAGNTISVDFTDIPVSATTVTVKGATITVDAQSGAKPSEIKAAIAGNPAANALVAVTYVVDTSNLLEETLNLDGGTSTATVTSTFSEDVSSSVGVITYDGDGGFIAVSAAASTAVAAGNVVVSTHLLTAANQLPELNRAVVEFEAGSVVDNGGNPIAAVTRIL
jgi:ribosomal protein S8E